MIKTRANVFTHGKNVSAPIWPLLALIAFGSRLLAAFFLPNAEQDGYSYAEAAARWTASLAAGHFRLGDLFGFWLPLFQFATALLNLLVGNALLAGKILSALCGATGCLFVFALTRKMTGSLVLGCLGFALVVSNPLHLLYSAACMTDVPHSCLVLVSLWFVVQRRWMTAAIFAALAESMRVEAWVLVIVIPMLQFIYERRISVPILLIVLLPPLAWLGINQLATGNPLAFLAERVRYQASYMDFHDTRHVFTWSDVRQDTDYFLLGANRGVAAGSLLAGALVIGSAIRARRWPPLVMGATLLYAAALLGFIMFSYVTRRQPVLFPRYGLIFFGLGLPLLVWLFRYAREYSARLVKLAALAAILICLWDGNRQVSIISKVRADFKAHEEIARTLENALQGDPAQRCFSDDVAIRVLSGLPSDRFVYSESGIRSACPDAAAFESYLRKERVAYLIFTLIEDSLPPRFYPDLGDKAETNSSPFRLVRMEPSPFASNVWLFQLREIGLP